MVFHLHQTVSRQGGYEVLEMMESSSVTAYSEQDIQELMDNAGVSDPIETLHDFESASLFHRAGDKIGLTSLGVRTAILLQALNGGDLKELVRRLTLLDTTLHSYELVQEGMTRLFLRNLNDRPGFVRVYFCSPWISLDIKEAQMLANAVIHAERGHRKPELIVITRPEPNTDYKVPESLKPFQDLGASIFLNNRLHTKLYIREPDTSGGYGMAIVGSQNLTKSHYLELGVRINSDSELIRKVINYFWRLTHQSHEA